MADEEAANEGLPRAQYLPTEAVLPEMCREACWYTQDLSVGRILVLALMAGGFIALGAHFSLLLSSGVTTLGPNLLLEGLGFSTGFLLVILSRAALFSEANVILPASLLQCTWSEHLRGVLRFWVLAWVGNLAGAMLVGWLLAAVQQYPSDYHEALRVIIDKKMSFRETGGVSGWAQLIVSGMLGNWMVGVAAFFAVMGRTIIGKFVPVFLGVTLFVAANLQHSPANMGYFSLIMPTTEGPGWATALGWNIIPAGIGNILGGALLVALPFYYVFRPGAKKAG